MARLHHIHRTVAPGEKLEPPEADVSVYGRALDGTLVPVMIRADGSTNLTQAMYLSAAYLCGEGRAA